MRGPFLSANSTVLSANVSQVPVFDGDFESSAFNIGNFISVGSATGTTMHPDTEIMKILSVESHTTDGVSSLGVARGVGPNAFVKTFIAPNTDLYEVTIDILLIIYTYNNDHTS